jgi:hypothetical protein
MIGGLTHVNGGANGRHAERPNAMQPGDMIDIQSFLWVQGSDEYPDWLDRPRGTKRPFSEDHHARVYIRP